MHLIYSHAHLVVAVVMHILGIGALVAARVGRGRGGREASVSALLNGLLRSCFVPPLLQRLLSYRRHRGTVH